MLSSGLNLAIKQITDGNLKPSDNVKSGKFYRLIGIGIGKMRQSFSFVLLLAVITSMNSKYKMILLESKKLNGSGLLQKASANNITADKILYEYAIQMVGEQNA